MNKKQINKEIKFALENKIDEEGIFWYASQKNEYKPFDIVMKYKNGAIVIVRLKKMLKPDEFICRTIVWKKLKKKI